MPAPAIFAAGYYSFDYPAFLDRAHSISIDVTIPDFIHTLAKGDDVGSSDMQRKKPHFIIVAEKWCDYDPQFGDSPSQHAFWGPLEALDLATYSLVHYDQEYVERGVSADAKLLRICAEERPDFVFLIYLIHDTYNPSFETLLTIREKLKIPIFTWWGDTNVSDIMRLADILGPHVDLTCSGDSTFYFGRDSRYPDRWIALPHGKDMRIFDDPRRERDIEVSFVGSVNRPERQAALAEIRAAGVEVFQAGGQREQKLTIEEYAAFFQRSQMTINLVTYGGENVDKINGRIFEATLCGTLLLEPEWSNTKHWYEAGVEYVSYRDVPDLVTKIDYYRNHPAEREKIARAGYERAVRCYNGRLFWQTLHNKAREIGTPDTYLAQRELARTWLNAGRSGDAINILHGLLSSPILGAGSQSSLQRQAEAHELLGQALERENQPEEAECAYRRAISFAGDKTALPALVRLACLKTRQGAGSAAAELFRTALHEVSSCRETDVLLRLGDGLLQGDYLPEALRIYTRILELQPNHPEVSIKIAALLFKSGNRPAAEGLLKELSATHRESAGFHTKVAELQDSIGNHGSAAQHRWFSSRPNDLNVAQTRQSAWFLVLEGRIADAAALIENHLVYQDHPQLRARLQSLAQLTPPR